MNEPNRHPLYTSRVQHPDADGMAGDAEWNNEKFLVSPGGAAVERFRPRTHLEDDRIVSSIYRAVAFTG